MSKVSKITDSNGNAWVVVPVPEYVDGNGGQQLLDVSVKLLGAGILRQAFDMTGTRVVNSVGISRLIEMIERLDEEDGTVAFITTSRIIAKSFQVMGLLAKSTVCGSVQELCDPPSPGEATTG